MPQPRCLCDEELLRAHLRITSGWALTQTPGRDVAQHRVEHDGPAGNGLTQTSTPSSLVAARTRRYVVGIDRRSAGCERASASKTPSLLCAASRCLGPRDLPPQQRSLAVSPPDKASFDLYRLR